MRLLLCSWLHNNREYLRKHDKYLIFYPASKIIIWFSVNLRSDQLLLSFEISLWNHAFIYICWGSIYCNLYLYWSSDCPHLWSVGASSSWFLNPFDMTLFIFVFFFCSVCQDDSGLINMSLNHLRLESTCSPKSPCFLHCEIFSSKSQPGC